MGGLSSRNKGKYGERAVRDALRALGWEAERVPGSGAYDYRQGDLKGDVVLTKNGITLKAEVKFKKDEYKSIYGLVDAAEGRVLAISFNNTMVRASYNFRDMGFSDDEYGANKNCIWYKIFEGIHKPCRATKKLLGMHKLLKGADFLAIKINNRPIIYIRYWGVK